MEAEGEEVSQDHVAGVLAFVGIAGFAFFVAAIVSLHVLRRDYDPRIRYISEYAVGPYGYLMTAAFFASGIGSLALSLGIRRALKPSPASRAGVILLWIGVAGGFTAGIFPTDLSGDPQTTHGAIHGLASIVGFLSFIAAILLLSVGFGRDPRWRRFLSSSLILGLVAGGTLLLVVGGLALGGPAALLGVGTGQRIIVAELFSWFLVAAVWLRGVAAHPQAARAAEAGAQ